jgi:hypothetical protein
MQCSTPCSPIGEWHISVPSRFASSRAAFRIELRISNLAKRAYAQRGRPVMQGNVRDKSLISDAVQRVLSDFVADVRIDYRHQRRLVSQFFLPLVSLFRRTALPRGLENTHIQLLQSAIVACLQSDCVLTAFPNQQREHVLYSVSLR